jgi:hypothetical protein
MKTSIIVLMAISALTAIAAPTAGSPPASASPPARPAPGQPVPGPGLNRPAAQNAPNGNNQSFPNGNNQAGVNQPAASPQMTNSQAIVINNNVSGQSFVTNQFSGTNNQFLRTNQPPFRTNFPPGDM